MVNKKVMFGLLLFSVVLISSQFVSALTIKEITRGAVFKPVVDMFTKWESGNLGLNVAKYLIWILLTLLIYSVAAKIPFLKGDSNGQIALRWSVAVIVSFLSAAYLTSDEIYTILASYSTLGVVLSAAIPFLILMFFTIEISKEGAGGRLFSKFLWVVFLMFLVLRLIWMTAAKQINLGYTAVSIVLIGLGVFWVFFEGDRMFARMLFKEEVKSGTRGALEDTIDENERKIRDLREQMRNTQNEDELNRLEKRIDDLGKLNSKLKSKL